MQLFNRALPADCNIYLASDLHIGSLNTHYHGIEGLIDTVARDRKAYLIILGDLCEAICCDDKRYDPETNDPSLTVPVRQYEKVVEILKPIAKKILYINDGNHDYKLSRVINFVRDIVCKQLDVPYGTYSSKLTVCDSSGNQHFKVFTTHGYGSISSSADDPIRRRANMELALKRKLHNKAADCCLMAMGHTHKLIATKPTHSLYLYDDGSRVKQSYLKPVHEIGEFIHPDHRWFVNTGSFLKNFCLGASSYSERFGYDPVPLGYCKVEVRDYKINCCKEIEV